MNWLGEWWRQINQIKLETVAFLLMLLVVFGVHVRCRQWPPSQTYGAKEVAQALGSARAWEKETEKAQARYEEALSKLKTCREDLEHELRVKAARLQACEDDLVDQQVPAQELLREKKR